MSIREPVVAGQFYPAEPECLRAEVRSWLLAGAAPAGSALGAHARQEHSRLLGLMLPHAGYVYCGRVIGATLASPWDDSTAGASLPQRLIILCPNHTGQGRALGVWPEGAWLTPLGPVPVDAAMAEALCGHGGFAPDQLSHTSEHSLEVLLPFLQSLPTPPGCSEPRRITPICVGTRQPEALRKAGLALAEAVRASEVQGQRVALIVSSDMNHYENQEKTLHKDALTLAQALACNPDGLLTTVEQERSTMCGASPLATALYAAHALGSPWAELSLYDTSATASGDATRVVGYSGMVLGLRL